jgi:hypothetical protein
MEMYFQIFRYDEYLTWDKDKVSYSKKMCKNCAWLTLQQDMLAIAEYHWGMKNSK